MPAPRLLPDNAVLADLRRQGWTYADIAAEYGVSESAVYLRLRQVGATKKTVSHRDVIPWKVKREHTYSFPAQMLRVYGRKQKGLDISDVKDRMLRRWLRGMEDAGVVLCYAPAYPPNPACAAGGFYYSRRRPEDGDSIVRTAEAATVNA